MGGDERVRLYSPLTFTIMLFKKGDWVWYADKQGTHCLPVGIGMPCIPITERFTEGPGLMITEDGLHHTGASIYNTFANVTENNTHIIFLLKLF